jgi:glycine dehydrogenase subunit 2
MKYNPKINDETAARKEFLGLHPLQPESTVKGALEVTRMLRQMLSAITGMHDFTLKPCAGAHGELAG